MLGKAINTIGLCIIGGKYILMLILAAMTLFGGSLEHELLTFSKTDQIPGKLRLIVTKELNQ
ncbi:hypothetical protein [uncultured Photobacterium sp.]|uniref:hypothetical protein n=1 Tax=uncultured Photobacterium sp. TaxID=173973 RepID=UPI002637ECCF|nr:hypothetical protein [uncultured Photobacterium sp.]